MNCSGTWWLCNPRPPLATAAHHHRCLLDPVLCCCGAEGPPQPPASYGATWWPNVAQNPFTRVPSHHYHQRPIKRGRSPERGFSCYCRAQGPPMCLAAPNDRRVWYNAERRLKRRPQPLLPARRWIELNDSSSSPSVSSDASQGFLYAPSRLFQPLTTIYEYCDTTLPLAGFRILPLQSNPALTAARELRLCIRI